VAGVTGRIPNELALDGGFSSRENLEKAVDKGVETVWAQIH